MPDATDILGLDLGGTTLKSGWVDLGGSCTDFTERPWGGSDPLAVLRQVLAHAGAAPAAGVGLACAGVIDAGGVLVEPTPHLPIPAPSPLAQTLMAWTGRPVHVLNDADAAALAEFTHGAARGAGAALVITVGTGVGCGVVVAGRLWPGAGGGAGELGHVPLFERSSACACGVPGCAEPAIGGNGLAATARVRGLAVTDAAGLFARAEQGDAQALAIIEEGARQLGRLTAFAVQLLAPDVVVFGGKLMARAGDTHLARVRASLLAHLPATRARPLAVRAAALGERSGVVGAALWARDHAGVRTRS